MKRFFLVKCNLWKLNAFKVFCCLLQSFINSWLVCDRVKSMWHLRRHFASAHCDAMKFGIRTLQCQAHLCHYSKRRHIVRSTHRKHITISFDSHSVLSFQRVYHFTLTLYIYQNSFDNRNFLPKLCVSTEWPHFILLLFFLDLNDKLFLFD